MISIYFCTAGDIIFLRHYSSLHISDNIRYLIIRHIGRYIVVQFCSIHYRNTKIVTIHGGKRKSGKHLIIIDIWTTITAECVAELQPVVLVHTTHKIYDTVVGIACKFHSCIRNTLLFYSTLILITVIIIVVIKTIIANTVRVSGIALLCRRMVST